MASQDPTIEAKLKALREYWYNDDYSLKWVDQVEKNIRRLVTAEELAQNKAVIAIVEDSRNRVATINKLLIYDEKMDTDTRKLLIREKAVHSFYLDRFDGKDLDTRMDEVAKSLDSELENIGLKIEGGK